MEQSINQAPVIEEIEIVEEIIDPEFADAPVIDEEPEEPKREKLVRLVDVSPACLLFPSDEFELTLQSVRGTDYPYTDPSKCLSWITRRDYNGEAMSSGVQQLWALLRSNRKANTLARKIQDAVDAALEAEDELGNRVWKKLWNTSAIMKAINLEDTTGAYAPLTTFAQDLVDKMDDLAAIDLDETVTEAVTDEEDNVTVKATKEVDFSSRIDSLATFCDDYADAFDDISIELAPLITIDED